MRKLIAAMNMTLDGYCDHTVGIADEEIHDHYTELLNSADTALYGRTTFHLMEYWRSVLENPTGEKSMDDFAVAIDKIQKIVYSRRLKNVDWRNTELKSELRKEDVLELKLAAGKDIIVGSPSLIVQLGNMKLIDEYQLGIHPIIIGSGLQLFKNITERIDLELVRTKPFTCGVIIHAYTPKAR